MNEASKLSIGKRLISVLKRPGDLLSKADSADLDSDASIQRIGYAVVAFLFIGFGGWATLAPLESAAFGMGSVQVEGDSKPIQHLEGGIVSEILVRSGDEVKEGQPVLLMDTTQLASEKKIIEGRYWAFQAQVSRLESELAGADDVDYPDWLTEIDDSAALVATKSETALFRARLIDRRGEVEVLQQRIAQLGNQISGIRGLIEAKQRISNSLKSESEDLGELLEEGYVDKRRIRELDRANVQTLGEIADLEARIFSAEAAILENELSIAQINKRFTTQVVESLGAAQEQLFDYRQRLDAITDKVNRATVRSPISGTVVALQPNTKGEVVAAGQDLMAIVPDEGRLIIDVALSPMDVDRLHVGQEAEVRFAVFKDSYTITGRLMRLSADALMDEITGQPYYEGKVELLEEDLKLLGPYQLVPGMPADVLIKTGRRTLLGYLTSPLQRMFEKSLIED